MMSPTDSTSYYQSLKQKWETDYPSSSSIEEIWAFYKECGYDDPVACFARILERIEWSSNRVLDFGCDNGLMLNLIHELRPRIEGVGIDINGAAIAKAASRFPDLSFSEFDGVTIPFDDGCFDVVYVSAVLKHIRYEDRDALFAEFRRTSRHLFVVEIDTRERETVEQHGWTFYHSNFRAELERAFEPVDVFSEAGDLWGLYRTS